jgi:hypothetical protein
MITLMSASPSEVVSVLTKQKIAELKAQYGPRVAKYAIELRRAAKELLQAGGAD